jgi:hypothetical protein
VHAKVGVRRFDLIRRRSDLTATVKHLAYLPLATFNPDDLKNVDRLPAFYLQRQSDGRSVSPEIRREGVGPTREIPAGGPAGQPVYSPRSHSKEEKQQISDRNETIIFTLVALFIMVGFSSAITALALGMIPSAKHHHASSYHHERIQPNPNLGPVSDVFLVRKDVTVFS